MVSLKNIPGKSALAHIAGSSSPRPDTSGGSLALRDMGLIDKITLRCVADNPVIKRGLERVVGAHLPLEAHRFNTSGHRSIIWCAPDEWLILSEDGTAETIMAELDVPEAGHVAVVNVSDAFGGLMMEGVHARDALAKHCSLDFHAKVFTPGMAQQSLLSHSGVMIICRGADEFLIMGRTSFMPYIAALMMDAAVEYGYDYTPAA